MSDDSLELISATLLGSLQDKIESNLSELIPMVSLLMSQVAPRNTKQSCRMVDLRRLMSQPKRAKA